MSALPSPANSRFSLSPARVLVLGFAGAIVLGTLLLLLPLSTAPGKSTGFLDALFTATSAVCVTGLVVVDTGTHWSVFGQAVILLLIQAGGLGIMTMSTMFALIIGKKITFRERIVIQEALGQPQLAGIVKLTKQILGVTFAIELAGMVLMTVGFSRDFPLATATWYGLFHSVSAFCNAGFDLLSKSFVDYVEDPFMNLVLMSLIIVGGIGFMVISELLWRRSSKRSLHSWIVLRVTAALLIVGFITIFTLEFHNDETLGRLSLQGKLLGALFHSVTPRTAGFNTLPTGSFRTPTLLFTIILMFIGGSPGGTAGGIKTTTFAAMLASVWTTLARREAIEIHGRRLGQDAAEKALAIIVISVGVLVLSALAISVVEQFDFMDIMFETTSAFGTVGLSTGITPMLSPLSRIFLIITMFTGRVGPLTLAFAIAYPSRTRALRYPEEKIMIG